MEVEHQKIFRKNISKITKNRYDALKKHWFLWKKLKDDKTGLG